MIRVALKSLAARRLRTALTALAIVLGVAMVSGAFTITDTMRGAADSLSSAAYDGTDAVVTARTAFAGRRRATGRPSGRPSTPACSSGSAPCPGVGVAAADVTDEAKIIKRDGKPAGDGPYFGVGFDARDAGRRAAHAVPARRRPLGRRPGRGRDRRRHRRGPGLRRRRHGRRSPRAASPTTSRSSASRASAASKSLGVATSAVFDLDDRAGAVRPRRPGRRHPRRRPRRRRRRGAARRARRRAAAGPGRHRRRAGPLHARRARAVHLDHPDRAARVRRRGGARRRVHHLQHALDHRRPAHA